jgi:hypothetical protein
MADSLRPGEPNPFAEQVNPYAAPHEGGYSPVPGQSADPWAGLWRQGNVLVMHRTARLPDICVKSNQPATRRLVRKLSWHHPALALSVLIAVPVYLVLALVFTKRATIEIGLTEEWYARRRRRLLFTWIIVLLAVVLFIGALFAMSPASGEGPAVALGFSILLFLAGIIYGNFACRMVWPQRITDQYLFLRGVSREFLDRLEPFTWRA